MEWRRRQKKRQCQIPTLRAEECQERNLDGKTELATLLQKVTSRGYIIPSFLQSKATTRVNISSLNLPRKIRRNGTMAAAGNSRKTHYFHSKLRRHSWRNPSASRRREGRRRRRCRRTCKPRPFHPPPFLPPSIQSTHHPHQIHSLDPPGAREC